MRLRLRARLTCTLGGNSKLFLANCLLWDTLVFLGGRLTRHLLNARRIAFQAIAAEGVDQAINSEGQLSAVVPIAVVALAAVLVAAGLLWGP